MPTKSPIHPPGLSKPFGVWTTAFSLKPERLVFVSGLTARDAEGRMLGHGDVAAQTRRVCENLRTTMEAAGGSLRDIVWIQVFVSDIARFNEIHAVRREFFPVDPPASTMVEASRFVDKDCLIEINAIANVTNSEPSEGEQRI